MSKVLRSDKSRFSKKIENTKKGIVITTACMSKFTLDRYSALLRKNNVKSTMILKRLFYKLFVGERGRNQKTPQYGNNMHIISVQPNTNYRVFSKFKLYGGKIVGALDHGYFSPNANLYIKSKFNSNAAAMIVLLKMLTMVAIGIKNSKILNKG